MRVSKSILIAGLLSLWTGWSCRGKEGPQGPAGQDLTRPQNGYIEGRARGKDNSGNSFNIPFRYTYYYFNPGTYQLIGPDSFQIDFERAESLGIGSLSFSFKWGRNGVADVAINGTIADPSQNPVPTYEVVTLHAADGLFQLTPQSLSNLFLSGDTLRGSFQYVHLPHNRIDINVGPIKINVEANNHPDTVEGSFLIKLVRGRRHNREAGP